MNHEPHTGFIVAAYLVAFAVIGAMVFAILADHRSLKRSLKRLAARGIGTRDVEPP